MQAVSKRELFSTLNHKRRLDYFPKSMKGIMKSLINPLMEMYEEEIEKFRKETYLWENPQLVVELSFETYEKLCLEVEKSHDEMLERGALLFGQYEKSHNTLYLDEIINNDELEKSYNLYRTEHSINLSDAKRFLRTSGKEGSSALFHTHPSGNAVPSSKDMTSFFDGCFHILGMVGALENGERRFSAYTPYSIYRVADSNTPCGDPLIPVKINL